MGSVYSQLTVEGRIFIEVLLRRGASMSGVAAAVRCHRTTVWRELQRAKRRGIADYVAHFGQLYSECSRRRAGLA